MSLSLTQVPDGAPRPQQREHRGLQQQEVLAPRRPDAADEARRQLGEGRLLGHQKPTAQVAHHSRVGVELRLCLLKRQPKPSFRNVRF